MNHPARHSVPPVNSGRRPAVRMPAAVFLWLLLILPAAAIYEIPLQPGWNLISLPGQQEGPRVQTVTSSIEGLFSSIWTNDATGWHVYYPDEPGFSDLRFMNADQTCWIYMDLPGTLVGPGMKPASTIARTSGWNYAGYNSGTPRPVSEWVQPAGGAIQSIWTMENGQWKIWPALNPGAGTLQIMQPGQGYEVECTGPAYLSIDVVIPPTTKVLDAASAALLTAITDSQLTFSGSTAQLAGLRTGDILVADAIPLAPEGFLYKINATQQNGSGWVFSITGARLDEAIQQGLAGGVFPITAAGINKAELPAGVTLVEREADPLDLFGPQYSPVLEFKVDHEVKVDEHTVIRFTGALIMDSQMLINKKYQDGHLEEFSFTLTGSVDVSSKISAGQKFTLLEKEWELLTTPIKLPAIRLMIGPVPVWFSPRLNVIVGAKGKLSWALTQKAGFHASTLQSLSWNRASGCTYTRDFDFRFYHDPFPVDLKLSAKFWVGPRLDVYVYGAVGPYLQTDAFLETELSTDPPFAVYLGVEVKAGIRAVKFMEKIGLGWAYELGRTQVARPRIYPPAEETVTGRVNGPGGALSVVQVTSSGTAVRTAQTGVDGRYSLKLPAGYYNKLVFEKTGYQTSSYYDVTVGSGSSQKIPAVTLQATGAKGNFGGTIRSAATGAGVPGLSLRFRKGVNATSGGIAAVATTAANGTYLVQNATPGDYTGEISGSGFATAFFPARYVASTPAPSQALSTKTTKPLISNNITNCQTLACGLQ